ncbi:uncharacterized protein LOC119746156 [Patiria miniata]|uniref:EF-hand domain-containing protein n=1 Tax=Patiria miniata TaxID=46514 RepID=A0A914BRG9_PATMI|nr:uncharacterized protein LOC119746156 [Patiria miniata]
MDMERNSVENRADFDEKFHISNSESSSSSERGDGGSSTGSSSSADGDDHTHCDSNSTSEEGRLRRLFHTCDSDGDGFIDGHDLLAFCRELNMEDAVQDIMEQLGAGETGRISCEEFISCQRKLKGEITTCLAKQDSGLSSHPGSLGELDAKLEGQGSVGMGSDPNLPQGVLNKYGSWPNSDNSLASSAARESWERDSGARDMSPEPGAFLQKLMESANSSSTSGGGNFLELANTDCKPMSKPFSKMFSTSTILSSQFEEKTS